MNDDVSSFGLTVLGSGGPFANATRASSGYVVWLAGKPSVLLDAGGGAFERIGRAGIDPAAIDLVLVSHTHIDHTGGLAPVVFAAAMAGRERPFDLVGPAGRDMHPGANRFAELLFGKAGAWSYLHTFDGFGCRSREVPSVPNTGVVAEIGVPDGVAATRIASVAVPHGMMPSVAYRIERGGRALCYSGDVAEESDALVRLAQDCDVLVHDAALPERDVPHGNLHAKPSAIGRVAARARCKKFVLSHVMPELEDELDDAVRLVREAYDGEIVVARDLLSLRVGAG